MTSLYNVKKIVINGNEVTKVAKHYNKNMVDSCKASTAVTVQAVEEAIEKNRIDCDFEYNKKHETNITYDELVVKQIKDTTLCLDNTYNMSITWNTLNNVFNYESDTLADVQHESVYIASTLKLFDENKFATLNDENQIDPITVVPSNVKEIIFSDKILNVGFDITSASSSDLVLRYNAVNLAGHEGGSGGPLIMTKGQYNTKLYIKGTFAECKLGNNIKPKLNIGSTGELHITGNFFDNADLDEAAKTINAASGSAVYPFGDFATSANLVFGKLVVEKDDLNTTIRNNDTNLATLIRTILHLDGSFTVEFETHNDN